MIKHFSEQQQNSGAVAKVIRTVGRILHNLDQPMFYFNEEHEEEEKKLKKEGSCSGKDSLVKRTCVLVAPFRG